MNAHMPQSLQTMEELRQLAAVPTQIISPRESKPIISIVQDVCLGVYRITKKNVFINQRLFFNLLASITRFDGKVPEAAVKIGDVPFWQGRQALSMVLPDRVNLEKKVDSPDEEESKKNENLQIQIRNGQILSGALTKDVYQDRTRGIVHQVVNEYGTDEARLLFDNTQRLICDWLVYDGFSVGISDLIMPEKTLSSFSDIAHKMKVQVYDIIHTLHEGKFENLTTKNNHDHFETTVNEILNKANKDVGELGAAEINDDTNRMINMITSKSKGNKINVAQMIGCVGQQNVDGRRIPYGFDGRTLPHYTKFDDGPESRGFVESSFIKGLTPQEFFFHAMGGREGLIDTAVNTSETGYIQRKLVKAMEDCKVYYDMSVRNASGAIIQYLYGEDGMDACKLESQSIPTIQMDFDKLMAIYNLTDGVKDFEPIVTKDLFKQLQKDEDLLKQRMQQHFDQVVEDREHFVTKIHQGHFETSVIYPVPLLRILTNIGNTYAKHGLSASFDLHPLHVLDALDDLTANLTVTKACPANRMFQILLRAYLSPKRVIGFHHLTKNAFDKVVQQIKQRFYDSLVTPCEMVGVVAAQSLGEPATQLVLNSVHYDTELLLRRDSSVLERVKIGEFIEGYLKTLTSGNKLETHPNDTYLGWLKEPPATPGGPFAEGAAKSRFEILSCDEDGKITWREVEAVTKHPVVNKDGSNTLLKVTTRSGREVIATKAKSFLMRRNNKIVQVDGEDIKVGDFLPVSHVLPVDEVKSWDLSKYLPKNEFAYSSDVEKALALSKKTRTWWKEGYGKEFMVPHSRSDTFLVSTRLSTYIPGCVYPKKQTGTSSIVPEMIPLDNDFGFLVGAYLAEGCCCSSDGRKSSDDYHHHLLISNVDITYQDRIKVLCERWKCNWHMDERVDERGHTATVRIHSVILATLMTRACGNGAPNKRMPAEFLAGPEEFVLGLIDGYFSGDGSVASHGVVSASSVSFGLLQDFQQLLVRFDIFSIIKAHVVPKEEHHHQCYNLNISSGNATHFANVIKLTLEKKQRVLDTFSTIRREWRYARGDMIPLTLSSGEHLLHRDHIRDVIENANTQNDIKVMNNALNEDVHYDEIISIVDLPNSNSHVYDLTIEGTRNFALYNGLNCADTFHMSGVSAASKAVRGVPRLNELLAVSKKIKTPFMRVFLSDQVNHDKKACMDIMNDVRIVRFKDIVKASKIYFDPNDFDSGIPDDRDFIELYRMFNEEVAAGLGTAGASQSQTPWLMRLEFDRDKMLRYDIDMITVHHVLDNFYGDMISCVFSDDNAEQLVMRVKLSESSSGAASASALIEDNSDDMLTDLKALEYNILESQVIKGLSNIEKAALEEKKHQVYNPMTRIFESKTEWIVITEGTNIQGIMSHPLVNAALTTTNDVNEIYEVFGIEAARQALYNEIVEVLDSIAVNYRHIALLVDVMTNKGTILSVNRHGINRGDIGPLAKCSFEETTDKLIKAGVFAEHDKINGVSANVMLGQIAPCGTGDVQIAMDELVTRNFKSTAPPNLMVEESSGAGQDASCTTEALDMHIPDIDVAIEGERKLDAEIEFFD